MKSSNSDVFSEHNEELRLAYLENLLSPDDNSKFEEHLKTCPDCAKQVGDLSVWISLLKSNKDALCPEEWQLFDYACGREDTTGAMASHLNLCSSCRNTVETFAASAPQKGMPNALWKKMTRLEGDQFPKERGASYAWLYEFWDQLANLFSPPLALAGAVAAAVLVVVLLYPHTTSGPFLGLSTVAWAPDQATSNLMGGYEAAPGGVTKKNRLAIIVYFKGFKHKPEAEQIDALYRLLDPGREVRIHYEVVSPSQIKNAVESAGMAEGGKEEILRVLRDKLSVSHAVIMELSEKENRFTIHARLTDTASGNVVREHTVADMPAASLSEQTGAASDSVLKTK